MADITPSPANVAPVTGGGNSSRLAQVTWGSTITRGKSVYLDTADNKWKLADNNVSALLAGSADLGVAMSDGGDGQPGVVLEGGDVTIGATLIVGETYIVSATPGGIAPVADIATGFVSILGVAISPSVLRIPQSGPLVSGIQHA